MRTTSPESSPASTLSRRLDVFLERAAFFLVLLAVLVRPLFSGLAEGVHVNIVVLGVVFAAAAMIALRGILHSQWPKVVALPLVLLTAYAVLNVALVWSAPYRHAAVLKAMDVCALALLLFSLGAVITSAQRARVVLAALLATALCVALFAIPQRYVVFPQLIAGNQQTMLEMVNSGHMPADLADAFRRRLLSREVFSTFVLSNSFACYLLLVTPLAVVLTGWALRRRRVLHVVAGVSFLLISGFGLYLSKAKGAWLTVPIVLVIALGVFWRSWKPVLLRRALLVVLAAGMVVVLGIGLFGKLPTKGLKASLDVRLGYWSGAWKLIGQHPLVGVGPGNFGDAYTQVKSPDAGEVQHPHNGYIEVWTETGPLGLLLWLTFWGVALGRIRKAAPTFDKTDSQPEGWPRFITGSAGILSFVFQTLILAVPLFLLSAMPLSPALLLVGLMMAWVGLFVVLTSRKTSDDADNLMAVGIWCGLVALLVHSLVDFDMIVPGITWTAVALVVCLWRLTGSPSVPKPAPASPSRLCPFVLLVAMVASFAAWGLLVMPISCSSIHLADAKAWRGKSQGAQEESELTKAMQACPGDAEPPLRLAVLYQARYERSASEQDLDGAIANFILARRLRPLDERASLYLARLYRSAERDQDALEAINSALGIYPTMPTMWVLRARIEVGLGQLSRAADSYERALWLAERSPQRERKFSPGKQAELLKTIDQLRRHAKKPVPPTP